MHKKQQVTWRQIIRQRKFRKGELEVQEEDGRVYHGPIRSICERGGYVFFEFEWVAVSKDNQNTWTASPVPVIAAFEMDSNILEWFSGNGNLVIITDSSCTVSVIFPECTDVLDPDEVLGLQIKKG